MSEIRQVEVFTSRFAVQGGAVLCGVKSRLHPIHGDFPLHLHDFYEMELVFEGLMEQTVNGMPLTSRTGDFVLMDLLSTQRIRIPEAPPTVWTLCFSPSEISPALRGLLTRVKLPLVGHLPQEKLREFHTLATRLDEAVNAPSPYAAERVTAIATLLLTLLLEHGEVHKAPPEEPRSHHYIQKALSCLNEEFASPLTLCDVAERIHISPCYLSDLFSRTVGCRFVEYLTHLRLEHARAMLRSGESSVATVAAACGFQTVSNFTRAFCRTFGVPPSAYRREAAQKGEIDV